MLWVHLLYISKNPTNFGKQHPEHIKEHKDVTQIKSKLYLWRSDDILAKDSKWQLSTRTHGLYCAVFEDFTVSYLNEQLLETWLVSLIQSHFCNLHFRLDSQSLNAVKCGIKPIQNAKKSYFQVVSNLYFACYSYLIQQFSLKKHYILNFISCYLASKNNCPLFVQKGSCGQCQTCKVI